MKLAAAVSAIYLAVCVHAEARDSTQSQSAVDSWPPICADISKHSNVYLTINSNNVALWNGRPLSPTELNRYLAETVPWKGVYEVWFILSGDQGADRKVMEALRAQMRSMGLKFVSPEEAKDCALAIP